MLATSCFNVVQSTIVKFLKPQFYKRFKTASRFGEMSSTTETQDSKTADASQDLFDSEPMDTDEKPENDNPTNETSKIDIPTNETSKIDIPSHETETSKNDIPTIQKDECKVELFPNNISTKEVSTNVTSQDDSPSTSRPSNDKSLDWRGYPMTDFNSKLRLKPIRPTSPTSSERHVVCVEFGKYKKGSVPRPFPSSANGFQRDCWDGQHVRMPFSPENLYPVISSNGRKEIQKR